MNKIYKFLWVAAAAAVILSCSKDEDKAAPSAESSDITVAAVQEKFYMTAEEDLAGKVGSHTAGLKVLLLDSKYYAVGERILSVSFTSKGDDIAGEVKDGKTTRDGKTVTVNWASTDPVHRPAVGHAPDAAEFGVLCLPGTYGGKFTVRTSRYTYDFTRGNVQAKAGEISEVQLDFASPDIQPTRKVAVMGDSISTFDGTMVSDEYTTFYPTSDPNVTDNPAIAVDTKEKTYWWKVIYNKMQHGTLDVNNSWSGTRVIHERKVGRVSGNGMDAGFVDRVDMFGDPDIILIHGGTNDKNQTSPLGNYDWDLPTSQLDLSSYRSAFIYLIKTLQIRYEGVQIILVIGDTLTSDYENSNITIAKHFGLPYVDFVPDKDNIPKCSGSHPTEPGFETMATKIYNTCKDYLP